MKTSRKFGLFTAICMIVGIVIGSGIFFKSDNVLVYTNGDVMLGVMLFVFAAFAIIFGSLTMAELATRTDAAGGVIAYAETFIGKKAGCVFGWFQNFIYYPTLIAVVSWVVGIYGSILFGIDATLELQIAIGFASFTIFYILNYISAKLAGYFQNAATIIKLIPVFLIAIVGIFFGNPDYSVLHETVNGSSGAWLAAVGPIAFSYDGWSVATNISHEIKNSKRNLPLALIVAPIFILITYVTYFIGISILIGPETIMALGDAHVDLVADTIFGTFGSNTVLVFVIISVMGTTNGLILGNTRGLYALGINKMIPKAEVIGYVDKKLDTPTNATIFSFIATTVWMFIHYCSIKFNLLPNSDISEIAIVTMYLLYSLLYMQVIKMKKRGEIKSVIRGYIVPSLAILGSLIIFYGGMQNAMFFFHIAFSAIVISIAYRYASKHFTS